jgi:Zn finger protein HypA/HybF involved in hydrogenase expression
MGDMRLATHETKMQNETMDSNRELMVDGNAAAGMFMELFGVEMTAAPTECAHCGTKNEIGALMAFTQAPGIVLRCPACAQVLVRIVQTPDALYLDARGAMYLRIARA